MRILLLLVALAGCGSAAAEHRAVAPLANQTETAPPEVAAPADRCVQVSEHFEPWRSNPDWAVEVSPRDQLIADCRAQRWSQPLTDCLLGANSPLELDDCIAVEP